MKEYVYFCKNCRRLASDNKDNRPFECEECDGKFQPLHVTVDEWKESLPEERRAIVNRAIRKDTPRNVINNNQKNSRNTIETGNDETSMDSFKSFIEKISVGEEGKNSKLAIVGFVLSFLGFFSIFGLAAGIIDLLKKDGRKKGFSIATICISVIMLIGSIGVAGTPKDATTDGIVAETNAEEADQEPLFTDNLVVDTPNITDTTNIVSTVDDDDSELIDIGEDTEIVTEDNIEETESETVARTLYTTSKVNIREQPNTDCAVLGKAEIGQEVIEYEAGSDGWSRIICGGVEGYIKSEYLTQSTPNNVEEPGDSVTTNELPAQSEPVASAVAAESTQSTPTPISEAAAVVASVPEAPAATTTGNITNSSGNGDNFNTYDNADQQQTTANWVLNTNPDRMKIHYPSCSSVKKISPENYATSNSSVAELQNQGYSPCGNCHPN